MGDYILKEISALLQDNIGDDDFLFRWGGEEFVILTNTNSSGAFEVAYELKNSIKNKIFQSIKITASFGIASMQDNLTKKELFKNCDKALYEAKNSGRDKVVVFSDK